jgi:transcription initiation factor TFIIIB Brf1 subunit/transcription initiation factor TFIIB
MSIFDNCTHKSIFEGVCNDCGLEISGCHIDMTSSYSEYHSHTDNIVAKPFEQDLKNLSIPDEVKNLVIQLAMSCPKETHRMGVRRQHLFSFIYLAYLQLGYKFDHNKLVEELKMTKREINMALRIISGTSSSEISLPAGEQEGEVISAPIVVISPMIYIEELCKNNNLIEQKDEIIVHAKKILAKDKILYEFNPKHIAVALVKHYLNQQKVNIPKFAKNNGISESILKQHMNRITI